MKRMLSILLALALVASLGITVFADDSELSLSITADAKSANVTGEWTGLFARVALILDNGGVSGLYITQAPINADGTIVVPSFVVPGLTVTGVNVSLVPALMDITSPTPSVKAMDFRRIGDPAPTSTPAPTPEPTPAPTPEPTPEPTPAPTTAPSGTPVALPTAADLDPARVVYVHNTSGKIHSVDNCSGMKNYSTMTLAEAEEQGYYVFCHNCWADDVWK